MDTFEWVEDISDFTECFIKKYISLKMTLNILNNWGCTDSFTFSSRSKRK